jgi:hypothetical protein
MLSCLICSSNSGKYTDEIACTFAIGDMTFISSPPKSRTLAIAVSQ